MVHTRAGVRRISGWENCAGEVGSPEGSDVQSIELLKFTGSLLLPVDFFCRLTGLLQLQAGGRVLHEKETLTVARTSSRIGSARVPPFWAQGKTERDIALSIILLNRAGLYASKVVGIGIHGR